MSRGIEQQAEAMMKTIMLEMTSFGSPRPIPRKEWFVGQLQAIRRTTIEECALLCDAIEISETDTPETWQPEIARLCARRIRALAEVSDERAGGDDADG